jgi:hypothetical protein
VRSGTDSATGNQAPFAFRCAEVFDSLGASSARGGIRLVFGSICVILKRMGREIVYCFKCQRQIVGDELDKGTAYQVGNQITCSSCAVHLLESLSPREKEQLLGKMFRETKERHASAARGSPGSSTARIRVLSTPKIGSPAAAPSSVRRVRLSPRRKRLGLMAGLAIGVFATLGVVVVVFGGSGSPVEERRAPGTPVPSPQDLRRQAAAQAIRRARDFAQAHPSDADGLVPLWQEAVFASDGTPYVADSRREHEAAKARLRDRVVKELADLDQRISGFVGKEEFKAAQDATESARSQHAAPEWALEVSKRAGTITETAAKNFPKVMEQAAAAKREGDEAAAAEFRVRVSRWGMPKYISEFDQGLAAVSLPKPLADPALVGYWPLDEGLGQTARDASGKGHTASLVGTQWVPGKFGSGLRFDGAQSVMELPNSAALDQLQEGDYTLAAWFKPEAIPPAGADVYAIIVKPGRHIGLCLGNEGRFFTGHWFAENGGSYLHTATYRGIEAGVFHHVASVVDWTRGVTRIYVNGVQEVSTSWSKPKLPAFGYGNAPWRVGCALPGAPQYRFAAKGIIDEVRLYARALGEAEVQLLYRARLSEK